jgi:short-subunit dehydrogenase
MNLSQRYPGYSLVTGASSGIGKAFATAFAQEGIPLVIIARREDRLIELKDDLHQRYQVQVYHLSLDLTDQGSFDQIDQFLLQHSISVGILVNNAGISDVNRFENGNEAAFEQMIALNCLAPMKLTHRLLRREREAPRAVIMTSSLAGIMPTPYLAVYSGTKAFLNAMTSALYEEYREAGVDFLTLNPGGVNTEILDTLGFPQELKAKMARPEDLVRESIRALMRRRLRLITGGKQRRLAFLARFLPERMVLRAAKSNIQRYYSV